MASQVGLNPGFVLDLDPDNCLPWGFLHPRKIVKAKAVIDEVTPTLLIGCPPCGMEELEVSVGLYRTQ
eukprot:5402663-Amphidinium_carterae.2